MSVSIWPGKAKVKGKDVTISGFSPDLEPVKQQVTNITNSVSQLSGEITDHAEDSTIHVTSDDKAKWDGIDSLSEDVTSLYSDKQDVLTDADKAAIAALHQDAVSDVQIAGTSILSDCVANIPIATTRDVDKNAGLIRLGSGFWTGTNGITHLNGATASDISARSQNAVLTGSNLDMCVKASLTDGKAVTAGLWDDDAKAKVADTLGLYRKPTDGWVLKGTMTDPSGINVDLTGCTELSVIGTITATGTTHLQSNIGIMIHSATYSGSRKFVVKFSDDIFGICATEAKYNNNTSSSVCTTNYSSVYTYYGSQTISGITKLFISDSTVVTSCEIKIYAR